MLDISPILKRSSLGKTMGLAVGIGSFLAIPWLFGETRPMLQWGLLAWYITFGAVIALGGFVNNLPFINRPFPAWARGAFYGAWLNFVLVLLAYDNLLSLTSGFMGWPAALTSPWWMIVDGAILGMAMDVILTRAVPGIAWPKSSAHMT